MYWFFHFNLINVESTRRVSTVGNHVCHICSSRFQRPARLKAHIDSKHATDLMKCIACPKFYGRTALKRHYAHFRDEGCTFTNVHSQYTAIDYANFISELNGTN